MEEFFLDKLTVGLEWFLNPDHMPLIIGIEKGSVMVLLLFTLL